jgi:hypothetical protein
MIEYRICQAVGFLTAIHDAAKARAIGRVDPVADLDPDLVALRRARAGESLARITRAAVLPAGRQRWAQSAIAGGAPFSRRGGAPGSRRAGPPASRRPAGARPRRAADACGRATASRSRTASTERGASAAAFSRECPAGPAHRGDPSSASTPCGAGDTDGTTCGRTSSTGCGAPRGTTGEDGARRLPATRDQRAERDERGS